MYLHRSSATAGNNRTVKKTKKAADVIMNMMFVCRTSSLRVRAPAETVYIAELDDDRHQQSHNYYALGQSSAINRATSRADRPSTEDCRHAVTLPQSSTATDRRSAVDRLNEPASAAAGPIVQRRMYRRPRVLPRSSSSNGGD